MTQKKYDESVTICENKKLNEKYYKLSFQSKNLSREALPGQFLQIQIQPSGDPFLRRPFSYYRIHNDLVEVLYEVLGRGTALLSEKKKGDVLQIMGPLGKPFTMKKKHVVRVLVAGGVGVPPLVFLAEKFNVDYLLIGTKSKGEILPRNEVKRAKTKVMYSTNDGSYGKKGFVTGLLEEVFEKKKGKELYIQTCGPTVMMQAVMDFALRNGCQGEASLDKEMACGIGACLGCMVKTHEGWKPSCVEGPVFPFNELVNC